MCGGEWTSTIRVRAPVLHVRDSSGVRVAWQIRVRIRVKVTISVMVSVRVRVSVSVGVWVRARIRVRVHVRFRARDGSGEWVASENRKQFQQRVVRNWRIHKAHYVSFPYTEP